MPEKPRGLRWEELRNGATLKPSWGYAFACGFVFAVHGALGWLLLAHPVAAWVIIYVAVFEALLVAGFSYPWWGAKKLSFDDGMFRVESLSMPISELRSFATDEEPEGRVVVAVRVDGGQVPVPLPLVSTEAEFVAARLGDMLGEARQSYGPYR